MKKAIIFLYRYFKENVPARVVALLWLVLFSSVAPMLFSSDAMNVVEIDLYLFYDFEKYPEHIAYDLSEWFSITTLIYCVYLLLPTRKYQNYARPFLVASVLGLPIYFLFYSQYVTLITIPMVALWQVIVIRRHNVEKGNNTGAGYRDTVNN